jgi:hypothetical protein
MMNFFAPTINDIEKIRKALEKNEKQACELSPSNTVLWARHYNTEIGFWRDEIIYRSKDEEGRYSYACSLLDLPDSRELFEMLRELAKQEGEELHLHCVSEMEWQLIEEWYPGSYEIVYNRDNADYIYLREKLATLSGKKLHGKRNHIHRFEEANPDWSYETINDENEEECARMAMKWCMKNCMSEQDEIEFDKIDESKLVVYAIRHRKELGMIGGALRVNGKIIAITLGEPLTTDTFVVHFEKAFSDVQGAYPMINREFVRHELETYTYVNREEDMGVEGLRKAKLSYRPDILFPKGQVKPKSS